MVGAVFAAHGLWWKEPHEQQRTSWIKVNGKMVQPADGYLLFENLAVREWRMSHNRHQSDPRAFAAFIDGLVPQDTRWFWKGGVINHQLFARLRQAEQKLIFPRRDIDGAIRSRIAKGHGADAIRQRRFIESRYAMQDKLIEEHGGVVVDTDEIIAREYRTLRAAFEYCQLPFDEGKTDAVIV